MEDIVIDTNVLLHAQNPAEGRFRESVDLLSALEHGTVRLCVDDGFSLDESMNRSRIGSEYLNKLNYGSVGYNTIQAMASSERLRLLIPKLEQYARRLLHKLVEDGTDRVFVKVAVTSLARVLVSHDYEDFPDSVRDKLEERLEINFCEAEEAGMQLRLAD